MNNISVQKSQITQIQSQSTKVSTQPPVASTPKPAKAEALQHCCEDVISSIQIPEGKLEQIIGFLDPSSEIIDSALSTASIKMMGARQEALRDFHSSISHMNQRELDEMKDTLVNRLASPESSQWDRDLLKQMYEITDAVSEHRKPPHLEHKFPIDPGFGKPAWPPIHKDPGFEIDPGFNRPWPPGHEIDPGFSIDPGMIKNVDPGFSVDPGFNRDPGIAFPPNDWVQYK